MRLFHENIKVSEMQFSLFTSITISFNFVQWTMNYIRGSWSWPYEQCTQQNNCWLYYSYSVFLIGKKNLKRICHILPFSTKKARNVESKRWGVIYSELYIQCPFPHFFTVSQSQTLSIQRGNLKWPLLIFQQFDWLLPWCVYQVFVWVDKKSGMKDMTS